MWRRFVIVIWHIDVVTRVGSEQVVSVSYPMGDEGRIQMVCATPV
jgi:hypothetical protein